MSWKEVCVVLLFSHWALTRKPWTSCSVKKCGRSTYVWSTLEFSARMNSISPWLGLIYHKDIEPFLRVAYSSCRLYFSHYANSQYFSFFLLVLSFSSLHISRSFSRLLEAFSLFQRYSLSIPQVNIQSLRALLWKLPDITMMLQVMSQSQNAMLYHFTKNTFRQCRKGVCET